ncbi:hypothetical protein BJX68DRAFT_248270 [Aspergillus pseudodeflectus]|uniref:Uncharacterized protein n=1 Tax=Aspergillus pseudodeflectus TaxID=176178 RepID=A0ABR4JGZ1_9EURO
MSFNLTAANQKKTILPIPPPSMSRSCLNNRHSRQYTPKPALALEWVHGMARATVRHRDWRLVYPEKSLCGYQSSSIA